MKQKDIRKKLKEYGVLSRSICPEEKESRIEKLLLMEPTLYTRGSLWDFILEQAGYLERYCLIWQILWMLLFLILVQLGGMQLQEKESREGVLVLFSLLPSLLVLLTVEEITKVYQKTMLEIEYATKYSLKSVVMIRMAVLCIFNFLILTASIFWGNMFAAFNVTKLLVYSFTPVILMMGIMLKLMQYCQGEILRNAVIGGYVLMAALAVFNYVKQLGWYRPESFRIWCIVCIAGAIFALRQFVLLNRKLTNCEYILR